MAWAETDLTKMLVSLSNLLFKLPFQQPTDFTSSQGFSAEDKESACFLGGVQETTVLSPDLRLSASLGAFQVVGG